MFGRELMAARERAEVRLRVGRRGLRRRLVGSVAESVTRHVSCSALVAR